MQKKFQVCSLDWHTNITEYCQAKFGLNVASEKRELNSPVKYDWVAI